MNAETQTAGTTMLVLVVDRSGSMQSIRSDMEGGIKALLEEQGRGPGQCLVTLAQFDTEYELVFQGVPAAQVGAYQLVPRGSTALLDAIGRTIGVVRGSLDRVGPSNQPDQVVFAVVTDGLENASKEWSRDKVMAAVKQCSASGWHFTFLGANQDAIKESGLLGVQAGSALTYAPAPGAVAAAMSSLSTSVGRLRRGTATSVSYTEEERQQSGTA